MKNKIDDLRNHLFAQLERLNDEDLTADELAFESKRGKAIVEVASVVVESAKLEAQLMASIAWGGTGFIEEKKTHISSIGPVKENNLMLDESGEIIQKEEKAA